MIEKENFKVEDLKDFVDACNGLIEGKFILADIKISNILKAISSTKVLYDLIAECMINYNFEEEYNLCKINEENSYFTLPEEAYRIVPFVFCLLVEIDSKKLNFDEFLRQEFPFANNQNDEYFSFAKQIIIPFRNSIAEIFDVNFDDLGKKENIFNGFDNVIDRKILEKVNEGLMDKNILGDNVIICKAVPEEDPAIVEEILKAKKEQEEVDLLLDRVLRLTGILDEKLMFVKNPLKKSNIGLILDGLYEATSKKSVKIIVALVLALNNIAGNEKIMKLEIKELNNICYNFYEQ